ncbi:MAG: TIGR02757 family protein [Bacteroidota bacterium]
MSFDLKTYLNEQVEKYNSSTFIASDPISIPHRFSRLQDIEITAFWTAMLAWGQRKTIIAKAEDLVRRMDGAPYDFIVNHLEQDRAAFLSFKHRTFQPTDTLYFLEFLQWFYRRHHSLEEAFLQNLQPTDSHIGNALAGFHHLFFSLPDAPGRTQKHVPTPVAKSTCKRLNMFLRWMVRHDERGVDFGLWKKIKPSQLLIPLDVHVERIARRFGLLERPQTDWLAVLELTERLKTFDAEDPVRYDFALFGAGVLEKTEQLNSLKI